MPDAASDAGGPHLEPEEAPTPVETPPAEAPDAPADPRWWGSVTLAVGGLAHWRAGPSTVLAHRRATDWRLWHDTGEDQYAVVAERPRRLDETPPEGAATARFSFGETPDTITVNPALPDRPVVVRPESSLIVPPGERVTLYASVPAWMVLQVEMRRTRRGRRDKGPEAAPVVLLELPTYRPSDTWFGPSTREGELCFAVRTAARLEVADLPLRPHRVIAPVTVENQGATPLPVTRVAVPMPFLALHVDRAGRLWCDGVQFTQQADGESSVKVVPSAPTGGERLAGPRDTRSFGQALTKTFSRLLRGT